MPRGTLDQKNLGSDLLFRTLVYSTIGDEGLNFRVRDGVGCVPLSFATKKNLFTHKKQRSRASTLHLR